MKNVALLFLLSSFMTAFSQQDAANSLPSSVQKAFIRLFGDSKVKSWEREEMGLYEVEFTLNGHSASATFNGNGSWQRTEEELGQSEMPTEVIRHAREMFPDFKIRECSIVTAYGQRKLYEVEIVKGNVHKSLIFDENNTFNRIELDEDDDDADKGPPKKG